MKKTVLIVFSTIAIFGGFYRVKNDAPNSISGDTQNVDYQVSPTDVVTDIKQEPAPECNASDDSKPGCLEKVKSVVTKSVEAVETQEGFGPESYYIVDPETKTDLPLAEIRKRVKLSPEEEENLAKYIEKIDYNEEGKEAIRKIWLDMKASKIASRGVIHEEVMDGPMPDDPEYDSEEP